MAKTVAIVNQKGGVGKTTTAVNLTAALGAKGYKTLLIDIDPQGNSTSGFGINKRELAKSSYNVLIGGCPAREAIIKTEFDNVSVMPSSMDLAGAELELVDIDKRESKLKTAIAPVKDEFDFILLDCPPSLGLITLNGLCAADSLMVPIQCEFFASRVWRSLSRPSGLSKGSIIPILRSKACCSPCMTAGSISLSRWWTRSKSAFQRKFIRPLSRGMSGFRRRRATVSP